MDLPKIHSITKKVLVALVGAFLLLFLLFHMTANLFILRHDDGAWYSAFCHFMGTNWVVKIVEVVLLGIFALHILLTLWLWATNRLSRPVRYHHKPGTKTHTTSALMPLTGILILAFLVMHFCQFYFVKIGWVKGEYMVKVEKLQDPEVMQLAQFAQQMGMSADELIDQIEQEAALYTDENGDSEATAQYITKMRDKMVVMDIMQRASVEGNISEDGKWVRHLTYDERKELRRVMPESDPEPDFYYMARQLFANPIMVLLYLITFVVLFLHMRHGFPSAFQTLGLNNYTYNGIIEVLGQIYTWIICLGFALVPILVYLGV